MSPNQQINESLNAAVAERGGHLEKMNAAVAERDEHLEKINELEEAVKTSQRTVTISALPLVPHATAS